MSLILRDFIHFSLQSHFEQIFKLVLTLKKSSKMKLRSTYICDLRLYYLPIEVCILFFYSGALGSSKFRPHSGRKMLLPRPESRKKLYFTNQVYRREASPRSSRQRSHEVRKVFRPWYGRYFFFTPKDGAGKLTLSRLK